MGSSTLLIITISSLEFSGHGVSMEYGLESTHKRILFSPNIPKFASGISFFGFNDCMLTILLMVRKLG